MIDLSVPRHAQYRHKAWTRHQDAVYWVNINLAVKKGFTFCQTRSNAIICQETLPAYCIPKVVRMESGEVLCEVYMSPRPPPKISLKHEWKKELGSEHAQRSEVGQLSRSFQSNQPILNPICERTGRPVIETSAIQARSSEDRKDSNVEKAHERTRRLVSKQTQKLCQLVIKHVLFMKAKHSTLEEITHFVRERRDPLLIMTI